jgi:hypothetical protein
MMKRHGFSIAACIALGGLIAFASPGGAESARLKGLSVLSQELSARIAPEDAPFDLLTFMPGEGLEALAGTWQPMGSGHSFENGEPNAVNMALIRLTFSRFAQSLAQSCSSSQISLNDQFYDTLEALCTWPSPDAQSDEVMLDFWLLLMGYNAEESEFEAWRDFIRGTYGQKPAGETIEAMTLALMLNPYFLLSN